MVDSLTTSAIRFAADVSGSCVTPFLSTLKPADAKPLKTFQEEAFSYNTLYENVRSGWMKTSSHESMKKLLQDLRSRSWQNFLNKLAFSSRPQSQKRLSEIQEKLDRNESDQSTERLQFIAKMVDSSYTLNLHRLSNAAVMNLFGNFEKLMSAKQASAIAWQKKEIEIFQTNVKRSLFVLYYHVAEQLSDSDIKEIERIRWSRDFQSGQQILEEIYFKKLEVFFAQFLQVSTK